MRPVATARCSVAERDHKPCASLELESDGPATTLDHLMVVTDGRTISYVDIVRDKIIKGRLSSLQPAMPRRLRTDAVVVIR